MSIRLKQIQGMPVVDSRVARQAGVVDDVLVDPVGGRLAGLTVKHAEGWLVERVPAAHIYQIGRHAVLMADTAGLSLEPPRVADPRWLSTRGVVGMEVLTEDGDRVGYVRDVVFDQESLEVTRFELERQPAHPPFQGRPRIRPAEVVACSQHYMLVTTDRRAAARDDQSAEDDG